MSTRKQSCATEHDFDKFDDWRIFCRRCGSFMQAEPVRPAWPYVVWPTPYYPTTVPHYPVWWGSGTVSVGDTTTIPNGTQVTYTLNSGTGS